MDREHVWPRAWRDTRQWVLGSFISWILAFMVTVGGGILVAVFIPSNATVLTQAMYGALGALLALFLFVLMAYAAHLIVAPYRQRDEARTDVKRLAQEIDKLNVSIAYSLQVVGILGNWPKNADGLGIAIKLRNTYEKALRYQVRMIGVRLDNTALEDPGFSNNGGIVYDDTAFILPLLLPKVDPAQSHSGMVDVTIDYGRPDDQARRRITTSATMTIVGTGTTWYWRRQDEEAISVGFTDERPKWIPILDAKEDQTQAVSEERGHEM